LPSSSVPPRSLLGWAGVDQAAQDLPDGAVPAPRPDAVGQRLVRRQLPARLQRPVPRGGPARFGIKVVAVASAVIATWSFDRFVRTYFGSRPASAPGTSRVSTLLPVTIGQWPFLAGEARRSAGPGQLAAGSTSGRPGPRRSGGTVLAAGRRLPRARVPGLGRLLGPPALDHLDRGKSPSSSSFCSASCFPGTGPFPFPWTGLVPTELLCLCCLTPARTDGHRPVRMGGVALRGGHDVLLPGAEPARRQRTPAGGRRSGLPLLACFLTAPGARARATVPLAGGFPGSPLDGARWFLPGRWRYAAVLVGDGAVRGFWQWAPWDGVVTSAGAAPYTQVDVSTSRWSTSWPPSHRSRSGSRCRRRRTIGNRPLWLHTSRWPGGGNDSWTSGTIRCSTNTGGP